MRSYLFLALVLLAGCGDDRVQIIDPRAMPIVKQFVEDGGIPVTVSVVQGNTGVDSGRCVFDDETVYISPDVFEDPDFLAMTIYHELGHCVLFRPHDDRLMLNNMPESLMHSNPFKVLSAWYGDRDYYIDELFSGPW